MGDALMGLNSILETIAKECLFDGEFWQKFNQDKKELYNVMYRQLENIKKGSYDPAVFMTNCIVFKMYNDISRIRYYYNRYNDKVKSLNIYDTISDYIVKMNSILKKEDLLEYDSSYIEMIKTFNGLNIVHDDANYLILKQFNSICGGLINDRTGKGQ